MMTWEEAVDHINSVPRNMSRPGIECTRALLEKLGNPERALNIVHVAGTNGKGSTCMYIAGILTECGLRTGVFTSPHLIRENERIAVGKEAISDDDFVWCFEKVHRAELDLIDEGFGPVSYFDFFTGIAVLYFVRKNVDIAVLETGLGGRLDSTNAVESPLLTVITSIGLDHVAVLGNDVLKIAKEKAGIIKPECPVVYIARESYSGVIEACAEKKKVLTYGVEKGQCEILENTTKHIDFSFNNIYYRDNVFRLSTPALYQVVNAALAMTAAAVLRRTPKLADRLGGMNDSLWISRVKQGLLGTSWNGRMEPAAAGIYIDGAHNPEGISAFLETAGSMKRLDRSRYILLFSAVNDKDYGSMIEEICRSSIFDAFFVTQIRGARCLPADDIAEEFMKYTDRPVTVFSDVKGALREKLRAYGEDAVLFCAGSLYLAGEVRKEVLHL